MAIYEGLYGGNSDDYRYLRFQEPFSIEDIVSVGAQVIDGTKPRDMKEVKDRDCPPHLAEKLLDMALLQGSRMIDDSDEGSVQDSL